MTKTAAPELDRPVGHPLSSPDELRAYVPYLLHRLTHRWSIDQREALEAVDLNPTRMRILASLSAYGVLTINELSVLAITEQSSTSRNVEFLVESGLVRREINEDDQRLRSVALTEGGRRKVAEMAPIINNLYARLIEDLTPSELRTCIKALQKMADRICVNKV